MRLTNLFILFCIASLLQAQHIIPRPVTLSHSPGHFHIDSNTLIYAPGNMLKSDAGAFNDLFERAYHFRMKIVDSEPMAGQHFITLSSKLDESPGKDANRIMVSPEHVSVSGQDAGVFYGLVSLLQMVEKEKDGKLKIPAANVSDYPQLSWRGMHLDVCRHFFPVEFVKKYIDLIALYKMNTFHWHLTDDQGWRIEIKKYPLLTSKGSMRKETMIAKNFDPYKGDGIPYGGYYTQEQIKEVVAYAAARHITVVPEIEMPGHSMAAIAAYPQFSCKGGPFEVLTKWGVSEDVFCTKDSTFYFLQDVLDEVMALFPSKYIHIGGDECPKDTWHHCPNCQSVMSKNSLKTEEQLQSYFIQRIEIYLNSKGRQVIGWDEILEGGLAPNAAVMSWRGVDGGIAAARQGHNVVMTPGAYCYFDHYQGNKNTEPLAIGGYTPISKVYSYNPVPEDSLRPELRHYVLGAQGNVWTEYIITPQQVEYMACPRMAALAEVLWTRKSLRNYEDFKHRLTDHFKLLDRWNVNYSKAIYDVSAEVHPAEKGVTVALRKEQDAGEIRYTIDGSDPNINSPLYTGEVLLDSDAVIHAAYFCDSVCQGKVFSQVFQIHKATGKGVTLLEQPHPNYSMGGAQKLTDGVLGSRPAWSGAEWLGWRGTDMTATIDMGDNLSFGDIMIDVLQDKASWIYYPSQIELYVSTDNITYSRISTIKSEAIQASNGQLTVHMLPKESRYLRVIAKNYGVIPSGMPGAGERAWLFVDEIIVK